MTAFIVVARPLYPDGTEGEDFAAINVVSENPHKGIGEAMAEAIVALAAWWPPDKHADEGQPPDAIEITMTWKAERPSGPSNEEDS